MDSEIGRPHTTSAGRTTATGLPSRSMMTSSPSDTRGITKAKSLAASDSMQNPYFDICDPCAACCKDASSANVVTYSLRVLLARICPEEHSLWYGHDLAIGFASHVGATHRARGIARRAIYQSYRRGQA